MIPGTFTFADLPEFTQLVLFIQQIVVLRPAQDKTSAMQESLSKPGIARKATIPNMPYFFAS
jgi:hypothetical protein